MKPTLAFASLIVALTAPSFVSAQGAPAAYGG